jgi:putative peptide zinc metalloprotease protein
LEARLDTWHGTPLEPRNLGCYLEEGAHFLSVAPDERLDAVLLVDQGDRNDMQVGRDVDLKVEHLPDRTFCAAIDRISQRYVEFAPRSLSNKLGGELSTVTDSRGRERLTSRAYQANVPLDEDTELFTAGMRGKARFVAAQRSAWDWIWRYIRRTFHFRL